MEYEIDSRKLVISVAIYKYDAEYNCITIERVTGDTADFLDRYNEIQKFVFDEL